MQFYLLQVMIETLLTGEDRNEKKYIIVDKKQKTNIKGVFAAGDITDNPLKQIITACSEGSIAADTAYRELIK